VSPALEHTMVWVPVAVVVAVAMDGWAGLIHGRVWHTALWRLHVSHHRTRPGRFEANDALSVSHAPIAIALILYGCRGTPGVARELAFGVGIGMSLFGVAYVLVHDGLVHGRLPVQALLSVPFVGGYLGTVVRAHRIHHTGRAGGAPFSLFFGPWESGAVRERLTQHAATASARDPRSTG